MHEKSAAPRIQRFHLAKEVRGTAVGDSPTVLPGAGMAPSPPCRRQASCRNRRDAAPNPRYYPGELL
jgi:hypothetical protein